MPPQVYTVTKDDIHMDLVQVFPTLLGGFFLWWIHNCGKGSDCGRQKDGFDKTGICSGGEIVLVAEASATKDHVYIKRFKLCYVLAIIWCVGWGHWCYV